MKTRVAINGFGRIGRSFYRALLEKNFLDDTVEVVVVNDLVDAHNLAYLLKYDSSNGTLKYDVEATDEDTILVKDMDGNVVSSIETLALKVSPEEIPWDKYEVDVVIESTGLFTDMDTAQGHIKGGAKKVIISAPAKGGVPFYLEGVNSNKYEDEQIISNASCTTNCMGPIIQVLMQEGIGVREGIMTTIHAYTADQNLQDGPHRKDYRRGRNAAVNIVPTTSGSAQSMGEVFPELKGRLTGMAFRVPVQASSCIDFTFKPERETSIDEIAELMKKASGTYLKGILGYTEDEVVSTDFIGNPLSATFDRKASIELNPGFFKLVAWYDNEWGYSNRLVDLLGTIIDINL